MFLVVLVNVKSIVKISKLLPSRGQTESSHIPHSPTDTNPDMKQTKYLKNNSLMIYSNILKYVPIMKLLRDFYENTKKCNCLPLK